MLNLLFFTIVPHAGLVTCRWPRCVCENRLNTSHLSPIIYSLTSDLTLTSSRKHGKEDDVYRTKGMTEERERGGDEGRENRREVGQVEGHLTQRWNRHIDASWPRARAHVVPFRRGKREGQRKGKERERGERKKERGREGARCYSPSQNSLCLWKMINMLANKFRTTPVCLTYLHSWKM